MKPDEREMMRLCFQRAARGAFYDGPTFQDECAHLMHANRFHYILDKWYGKGWWDYGVSLRCGWPTTAGLAAFVDLSAR